MNRSSIIIVLALLSLFLVGFSYQTVPQVQANSGIVWQSYSLDDKGNWQLDSVGQNYTQSWSTFLDASAGLINQPSLFNLHGQIPSSGLTLILDANITVGASWDLVGEIPGVSLEILDFVPYSDLRGSPGRMTILITSASQESQDIQLTYHRPWLPDEKPERKLAISALTFPQSIDLSHEIIANAPPAPDIETNPISTDSGGSIQSPTSFPLDFDWRNNNGNFVTPVRDQGMCGSCWAHAIIAATESALLIDGVNFDRTTLDLSEQYLVSCRTDAMFAPCGSGNSSANAYHLDKWGQLYNQPGAVLESSFPYVGNSISCGFSSVTHPYKIASYTYVGDGMTWSPHDEVAQTKRNNINLIKTAMNNGPVGAGMYVPFNWCESSSCHPYVEPPEALGAVNHDILIVGWHDDGDLDFTDDYWIVKNSDGPYWNDAGYVNVSMAGPVIGTGAYYVDFPTGITPIDLYTAYQTEKVYIPLITKTFNPGGTWETLLAEDFEGSLSENWHTGDESDPSYKWGQSACRASTSDGHSLWWVGAGGTPLACGANYPKGINASAYYGPLDLTNATSAYMKFKLWTNTLPTYEFYYYDPAHHEYGGTYYPDNFLYGAGFWNIDDFPSITTPGDIYGNSSGWREMILDLSNLDSSGSEYTNMLNRTNVYVYFGGYSIEHYYTPDDYAEGIYIDDVVVKKCVGGTCTRDW
jgi:C1A family cysteine protease